MIIGIAGKKRSGKDTAAKVFERLGFTHDSFAAPMKRFISDILGHELRDDEKETPVEWLRDDSITTTSMAITREEFLQSMFGVTPRRMLQTLGTEWGASDDPSRPMGALNDAPGAADVRHQRRALRERGFRYQGCRRRDRPHLPQAHDERQSCERGRR